MLKIRFTLVLLFLTVIQCVAHSVVEDGDQYIVTHEWTSQDRRWSCNLNIPVELYQYYQGRAHQSDEPVQFVLSEFHHDCMEALVRSFCEGGEKVGYSSSDNMRNVIRFVQSLRYVTDKESKGEDEYVRFPVETLVDGVGDCEDMAILAAAILHEMGYGVLMVQLPEHLALAVDCGSELEGTYYTYQGTRYFYLEVTHIGWDIGQIPDLYDEVIFEVKCDLENMGPGTTDGLSVRVLFERHNGTVAVERVFRLDELREGESGEYELKVSVPRPFYGRLDIHCEGRNFVTESSAFDSVELP